MKTLRFDGGPTQPKHPDVGRRHSQPLKWIYIHFTGASSAAKDEVGKLMQLIFE